MSNNPTPFDVARSNYLVILPGNQAVKFINELRLRTNFFGSAFYVDEFRVMCSGLTERQIPDIVLEKARKRSPTLDKATLSERNCKTLTTLVRAYGAKLHPPKR